MGSCVFEPTQVDAPKMRDISCGSTFSTMISQNGNLFYCGMQKKSKVEYAQFFNGKRQVLTRVHLSINAKAMYYNQIAYAKQHDYYSVQQVEHGNNHSIILCKKNNQHDCIFFMGDNSVSLFFFVQKNYSYKIAWTIRFRA